MLPLLLAFLAFVVVVAGFAALAYKHDWPWTGLTKDPGDGTPNYPVRPARTAWDWLQLLIVPFVLALATVGLTLAQSSRDRDAQEQRAEDERNAAAEAIRQSDDADAVR